MTQLPIAFPNLPAELTERIRLAQASNLNDCERDVLDLLTGETPRAGRDMALSIASMQRMWAIRGEWVFSDRDVKQAAKDLLERRGVPVGSSRASNCPGYFLVADDSEAESSVRVWTAEIRSLAKRCAALSPNTSYVKGLLGQISAEMEGEANV